MGKLISCENYSKKNNLTGFSKGNYTNINAVSNTINYITRNSEKLIDRRNELITWGGLGILEFSTQAAINCFEAIQNNYKIQERGGRRVAHEFFSFASMNNYDDGIFILNNLGLAALVDFAYKCCELYYRNGFQVVFSIHYDIKKRSHIHFVVNAVSYITGKKFPTSIHERNIRESEMNIILDNYLKMIDIIRVC